MNEYCGGTVRATETNNMARMVDYQVNRANVLLEHSGWELKGFNRNQPRGKSSAASNSGSFTSSGNFRSVSPREFVKARNQSKRMAFLSEISPDDLKEHRLYLAHGGKVGYALDKHGDLQNVFNNGGPKGAGGDAVIDAIKNGATTLDRFNIHLTDFYTRYGFVVTGRMKFNDEFAPKDWDYELDKRPDIMFMAYQGGDRATIENRIGTFNGPSQDAKRYYTDWDSAKADSRAAAMGHDTDGQRDKDFRKALSGKSSRQYNREHSNALGREQETVRIRPGLLSDVTDTLIHYGGSIKTLEESGDCWRFGGWLVVFGSHDSSRFKDKFTAQTDFDIEDGERRGLYYNHGLDGTIKRTKLGDCRVYVKAAGVWIEGQIRKRTDYLKSHAEKIAANIESFGLSSGAPAHLVERKAVPGGHEILLWPLAEASITPTPAEPLTGCFSLKALVGAGCEALGTGELAPGCAQSPVLSPSLDSHSAGLRDGLAFDDHCARVLAAVGELQERVDGLAQMRCVKSNRRWSAGKFETLGSLADGLGLAAEQVRAVAQEHAPNGNADEVLQALARFEALRARMNGVG